MDRKYILHFKCAVPAKAKRYALAVPTTVDAFTGIKLLTSRDSGQILIHDMFVGAIPQMKGGPVPAFAFGDDARGSELLFDAAKLNEPIGIVVENPTDAPIEFVADLIGHGVSVLAASAS